MNLNTGRRQAQRIVAAVCCEKCGSTEKLERHHKDRNPTNNAIKNISVLCTKCHHQEHIRLTPATCVICGKMFQPKRSRRSALCGDTACSKELGKRSAERRWG